MRPAPVPTTANRIVGFFVKRHRGVPASRSYPAAVLDVRSGRPASHAAGCRDTVGEAGRSQAATVEPSCGEMMRRIPQSGDEAGSGSGREEVQARAAKVVAAKRTADKASRRYLARPDASPPRTAGAA